MKDSASAPLIDLWDETMVRARRPVLIAHRGGVVTATSPENSLAAIRLAALDGYDMVELDVEESKEHEPILFHDLTRHLRRYCGIDAFITDMTTQDLATVRYRGSREHIATLAEGLSLCRLLALGVMLDLKAPKPSDVWLHRIGELLDEHHLGGASIADSPGIEQLSSRLAFSVTQDEFRQVYVGEHLSLQGKFWFGIPDDLPTTAVAMLQKSGALVLPAINTKRYPIHAHHTLAAQDVARLHAAGVDGFQIDSCYRSLFRPMPGAC